MKTYPITRGSLSAIQDAKKAVEVAFCGNKFHTTTNRGKSTLYVSCEAGEPPCREIRIFVRTFIANHKEPVKKYLVHTGPPNTVELAKELAEQAYNGYAFQVIGNGPGKSTLYVSKEGFVPVQEIRAFVIGVITTRRHIFGKVYKFYQMDWSYGKIAQKIKTEVLGMNKTPLLSEAKNESMA